MDNIDYLIIGNSAAGVNAAWNIRKFDKKNSIKILTYENYSNYSKPLITYYLSGKLSLDKINFKDKNFYKDNEIDLILESKIENIDFKNNIAMAADRNYKYKKLLISTGGKPILPKISIKDKDGSQDLLNWENIKNISGIFTLTTLEDAINLKKYIDINNIQKASILGGGLIGLKAAEAFLDLGLNIDIIELSDRILAATFDNEASGILESKIKEKGSNIYTKNTIEIIKTKKGKIKSLILKDGTKIDCKLLVVSVGVNPDFSFFNSNILKTGKGIKVDDYMQTNIENVYAAGDVIESNNLLLENTSNIAIWPLAVEQGSIAGMNLAGRREKYGGGFFMNSVEILGIPSISMGLTNIKANNGKIEVLKEYRPEGNYYKKIVIREDIVVGAILIGGIERAGIYSGLIKNKINISKEKDYIAREDFGLIQLPSEYKKHLVVGEGIEV